MLEKWVMPSSHQDGSFQVSTLFSPCLGRSKPLMAGYSHPAGHMLSKLGTLTQSEGTQPTCCEILELSHGTGSTATYWPWLRMQPHNIGLGPYSPGPRAHHADGAQLMRQRAHQPQEYQDSADIRKNLQFFHPFPSLPVKMSKPKSLDHHRKLIQSTMIY